MTEMMRKVNNRVVYTYVQASLLNWEARGERGEIQSCIVVSRFV